MNCVKCEKQCNSIAYGYLCSACNISYTNYASELCIDILSDAENSYGEFYVRRILRRYFDSFIIIDGKIYEVNLKDYDTFNSLYSFYLKFCENLEFI